MINYINIVLTEDGVFCKAPLCKVFEGDIVCLHDPIGNLCTKKVLAVTTDSEDGETVNMIEKYIGYELPKVVSKYIERQIVWGDEESDLHE